MKLIIEIEADSVYDAFMAALPSIKANAQLCQNYPKMVADIGPVVVAMKPGWMMSDPEPAAFGRMIISRS